jgi:hypothetical protein
VTGRRGRRRIKLLDDRKERTRYSHLKEEALDRTMWRAGFGRGFGPVVRQTAKRMNTHTHTRPHTHIYMYIYLPPCLTFCLTVSYLSLLHYLYDINFFEPLIYYSSRSSCFTPGPEPRYHFTGDLGVSRNFQGTLDSTEFPSEPQSIIDLRSYIL